MPSTPAVFNLDDNCLICHSNALKIHPEEFTVDKHYRFEGLSDPADEAIVSAISSTKHNIKGTLVNGYGISSDKLTDDLECKAVARRFECRTKGSRNKIKRFHSITP